MLDQENIICAKFGIDEIYIHAGFTELLREKMHRRAAFILDGEDEIVKKYVSHDIVLIFNKQIPSPSVIYRFLKCLDQDTKKDKFIEANLVTDGEELFAAIKLKKYVLVTAKVLLKETYLPE